MKIINNEVKIIIGARSAIFSPISNLGLIILDEEHDSSYKQSDEMPCYHTRHIALMRGKLSNCPIVLGSATPDMTSFYKSQQKDYSINTLTERATSFIPKVTIVNMNDRKERQNTYSIFSSSLLTKIEQRLKKGEQIILFLNRRGFYNFLFCKNCSNVVKCPHCDMSLTYHKKENKLICHYCYFKKNPTKECPNCNDSYMQYKGFGTENIESSIKNIFPTIKTLRMDKDTTSTKNSHEDLFKQFRNGKADILIGTQMVIKGFHFPSVTLVGILNSDSTLNIPDFRSSENLFQMLTQAAGRAGRELNTGEVIIQTFLPKNKTILLSAKQDYNAFYNEEIIFRKLFTYPPFSSIIKILFIGDDEKKTKEGLLIFRKKTINSLSKDCIIHPIQASGKLKIKDRFRFFFLIRTHNILSTTKTLTTLKNQVNKNLKMLIDVDPLTTFF